MVPPGKFRILGTGHGPGARGAGANAIVAPAVVIVVGFVDAAPRSRGDIAGGRFGFPGPVSLRASA